MSIASSFSRQLRTPAPHRISTAGDWTHGVAPIPGMIDLRQSLGALGHRYFQNILAIPPFHEPSTVGLENINNTHASIREDSIILAVTSTPRGLARVSKETFMRFLPAARRSFVGAAHPHQMKRTRE